jgi:hypothetical protein
VAEPVADVVLAVAAHETEGLAGRVLDADVPAKPLCTGGVSVVAVVNEKTQTGGTTTANEARGRTSVSRGGDEEALRSF